MLSRVNYHPKWQSRSSDCSLIMVTTSTLDFLCLVRNIPSYTARDCPQVTFAKNKQKKNQKKKTFSTSKQTKVWSPMEQEELCLRPQLRFPACLLRLPQELACTLCVHTEFIHATTTCFCVISIPQTQQCFSFQLIQSKNPICTEEFTLLHPKKDETWRLIYYLSAPIDNSIMIV